MHAGHRAADFWGRAVSSLSSGTPRTPPTYPPLNSCNQPAPVSWLTCFASRADELVHEQPPRRPKHGCWRVGPPSWTYGRRCEPFRACRGECTYARRIRKAGEPVKTIIATFPTISLATAYRLTEVALSV